MSQCAMAFTQDLTGVVSYSLTSNNHKDQKHHTVCAQLMIEEIRKKLVYDKTALVK